MNFIKRVSNKISKLMILAFAILIIGGLVTYYQNKINSLEVPEKATAIVVNKDIKPGEVITGSHLIEKEIFKPDKLDEGISDMNKLVGKVALTTLVKGKEITSKEITDKENYYNAGEKELGITFEKFTNLVGGKARPRDLVDIMVSYPAKEDETKNLAITEPKLVVEAIRLIDVFDENNTSYDNSKEKSSFKPITVLVKVTFSQEKEIDKALKEGKLYLRRHGNEIQAEEVKEEQSKVIITGTND